MLTKGDVKAEKMWEGAKEGEKESRREGGKERKKEESLGFGALVYFDNHGFLSGPSSYGVLGARKHTLPPHS